MFIVIILFMCCISVLAHTQIDKALYYGNGTFGYTTTQGAGIRLSKCYLAVTADITYNTTNLIKHEYYTVYKKEGSTECVLELNEFNEKTDSTNLTGSTKSKTLFDFAIGKMFESLVFVL